MGRGYAAILNKTRYKLYCEKRSRAFISLVKATCTRLYSSADSHGSTRASNKFRHAFIHAPLLLEPYAIVRPSSRLAPRCEITKEFFWKGIRSSWATEKKKCTLAIMLASCIAMLTSGWNPLGISHESF